MTPELGQYMHGNAMTQVEEALAEYEDAAPYWFVTKFGATFSEGAVQHLYDYHALFLARALILQQPRSELVKYMDVPATERGDLFYILNLVAALEAPE